MYIISILLAIYYYTSMANLSFQFFSCVGIRWGRCNPRWVFPCQRMEWRVIAVRWPQWEWRPLCGSHAVRHRSHQQWHRPPTWHNPRNGRFQHLQLSTEGGRHHPRSITEGVVRLGPFCDPSICWRNTAGALLRDRRSQRIGRGCWRQQSRQQQQGPYDRLRCGRPICKYLHLP